MSISSLITNMILTKLTVYVGAYLLTNLVAFASSLPGGFDTIRRAVLDETTFQGSCAKKLCQATIQFSSFARD